MQMEKLTHKSREAFEQAQEIAVRHAHQQIDGEHLHAALLMQENGLIPTILNEMDVNVRSLTDAVNNALDKLPGVRGGGVQLYATRRLNELLLKAEEYAKRYQDEYIAVEHLYLALISETETASARRLQQAGITEDRFLSALQKIRGGQRVTTENPEETYQVLQKYGRDLNE
ncbi:MAG: Clp protease N-terminal domain-containing protein, partial [Bacillota bacterium]|nr:Clp protease N-terminal domain-containing protein [Bacillota bacterium]